MNAEAILAELESKRRAALEPAMLRELGLPATVVSSLARIGPVKIAGDYVVPTIERMARSNKNVPFMPTGWACFAQSGNGDLWLIRKSEPHDVAFLDHDKESRATAEPLGIDFGKWLELAWYMRAHDAAYEMGATAANKKRATAARKFLESLAKGLSKRYPYRLA